MEQEARKDQQDQQDQLVHQVSLVHREDVLVHVTGFIANPSLNNPILEDNTSYYFYLYILIYKILRIF
jgi:hypothetical protein